MSTDIPDSPSLDELDIVDENGVSLEHPGKAVFNVQDEDEEGYQGPERRHENRRQGDDRRAEVRFEPGKDERRSGIERRKGSWKSNSTI